MNIVQPARPARAVVRSFTSNDPLQQGRYAPKTGNYSVRHVCICIVGSSDHHLLSDAYSLGSPAKVLANAMHTRRPKPNVKEEPPRATMDTCSTPALGSNIAIYA